jgi:putative transposase
LEKPEQRYKKWGTTKPAALASDNTACQAAYRELLRCWLGPEVVGEIRTATNGNFALGGARSSPIYRRALVT